MEPLGRQLGRAWLKMPSRAVEVHGAQRLPRAVTGGSSTQGNDVTMSLLSSASEEEAPVLSVTPPPWEAQQDPPNEKEGAGAALWGHQNRKRRRRRVPLPCSSFNVVPFKCHLGHVPNMQVPRYTSEPIFTGEMKLSLKQVLCIICFCHLLCQFCFELQ